MEAQRPSSNEPHFTRRTLLTGVGALGLATFVERIASGTLDKSALKNAINGNPELPDALRPIFHQLEQVDESTPLEKKAGMEEVIDAWGAYLFLRGINDLKNGGHVTQERYAELTALTVAKGVVTDAEGREHLHHLTNESANALLVMFLAVSLADGMNSDLEKSFSEQMKRDLTTSEKVASMVLLGSALSPVATTLKSATIVGKMATEVAQLCEEAEDQDAIRATATSHIANLSGFILFGDPPFLAVVEKYGFTEGVSWQFKTFILPYLYSAFSATYKINKRILESQRDTRSTEWIDKEALQMTHDGLKATLPLMAKYMVRSMVNMGRYFGMRPQDESAIVFSLGEALTKKLGKLAKWPCGEEEQATDKEDLDVNFGAFFDQVDGGLEEISKGLKAGYEASEREKLTSLGMSEDQINQLINSLKESPSPSVLDRLRAQYKGLTINRLKEAVGDGAGDILNVFPFQSGCIPFLIPVFEKAYGTLIMPSGESVDAGGESLAAETWNDLVLFLMVMMFSSVADNYVACKVGLNINPNKPEIAVAAAIQGGALTAIGNMSNLALFDSSQYGFAKSLANVGVHAPDIAVNFAWTKVYDILVGSGVMSRPEAAGAKEISHRA